MNWEPRRRIEENYRRALTGLFDRFSHALLGFGISDPYDIIKMLHAFAETEYFKEYCEAAASSMVTGLISDNAANWREASQIGMMGSQLYEAFQKNISGDLGDNIFSIVRNNAELISTFPLEISKEVNKFITEEAYKGRRSENIAKDLLQQFPGITKTRLNLIARTETAKANTALVRTQSEDVGLDWYIWRTVKDGIRVREQHRIMEGVLCKWNDPPSPERLDDQDKTYGNYHPGEIFNCRCWPETIVTLQQISFPAPVHYGGKISYMTRSQFLKISDSDYLKAA